MGVIMQVYWVSVLRALLARIRWEKQAVFTSSRPHLVRDPSSKLLEKLVTRLRLLILFPLFLKPSQMSKEEAH